jgi:hypothetical protein
MSSIARQAVSSAGGFLSLVRGGAIARPRTRLGHRYQSERGGVYTVFRETNGNDRSAGEATVLVVGFRLKVIGSHSVAHRVFQRVCLLTTPFWSGFRGFRVKLWMVDEETKNYLGIYQWAGANNARAYADTLCRVLRVLSTRDSVWYDLLPNQPLDAYLSAHAA